jgi:hypothetical protein
LLDKNAFDFNYHPGSAESDKSASKTEEKLNSKADKNDNEMVLAWEEWHKRLCASIYHYWLMYGNIPGEGTVTLNVTREGEIDFELNDYNVNPQEQFSMEQRELFSHAINHTLQFLAHTDVLTFPEKSQRKEVTLTTRFSFTEREDGPQGYSWKKGDYERVHE